MAVPTKRLDLTILDRTILSVYVRQLLIFPFPNPDHRANAVQVLHTGLFEVLRHFPFLAGAVEQTDPVTGAMSVQYPSNIDQKISSQLLEVTTLETSKFDYDLLCREGVPPWRLPSDVFCPSGLRGHPGLDDPFAEGLTMFANGLPLPVFVTQATFVPKGLILSAYTHHSVVDGTGIAKIYQAWSGFTQTYGCQQSLPIQTDAAAMNNARHAFDNLIVDAIPMDLPEFRYLDDPALVPPLHDLPYNLSVKIFVFSAARITALAISLSSICKERISNFTALTALIWCHVTDARRPLLLEKHIQKTKVGIANDHRKRVGSLLPDDYLGNCANGMVISLPISSIPNTETMDEKELAPVALAISNGLSDINLEWFKARLLGLSKQQNSSKLWLNLDTRNGPDIFITSWMHIGADDIWAIPGTAKLETGAWGCKPTAVRKPQCAWEGGMQILPRQKGNEAPFEIMVCLEEGEEERLMTSLQRGKWVERAVDG